MVSGSACRGSGINEIGDKMLEIRAKSGAASSICSAPEILQ